MTWIFLAIILISKASATFWPIINTLKTRLKYWQATCSRKIKKTIWHRLEGFGDQQKPLKNPRGDLSPFNTIFQQDLLVAEIPFVGRFPLAGSGFGVGSPIFFFFCWMQIMFSLNYGSYGYFYTIQSYFKRERVVRAKQLRPVAADSAFAAHSLLLFFFFFERRRDTPKKRQDIRIIEAVAWRRMAIPKDGLGWDGMVQDSRAVKLNRSLFLLHILVFQDSHFSPPTFVTMHLHASWSSPMSLKEVYYFLIKLKPY